jgi:hypothetical protein
LPGVARRLSLFCFVKKVTKKGEPAALLFIFVFLSPLFSLRRFYRTGCGEKTRSYLQLKSESPRSSNRFSPTAPDPQQKYQRRRRVSYSFVEIIL